MNNKYFRYEKDLLDMFLKFKFSDESTLKSVVLKEVPIRWGNIDIVNIKNNFIPFSYDQCKVLSKPSNSRIFLKTKNNRPITKNALLLTMGFSESTIVTAIQQLLKVKLIRKEGNIYYRNIKFNFPKVITYGYEGKLVDYKKAYFQACVNKEYVDYSFLVFPIDIAEKINAKYYNSLYLEGIGLIGVSDKEEKMFIKAKKQKEIKPYLKLINMVQPVLLEA